MREANKDEIRKRKRNNTTRKEKRRRWFIDIKGRDGEVIYFLLRLSTFFIKRHIIIFTPMTSK